jgi:serine/threonine protein kinase
MSTDKTIARGSRDEFLRNLTDSGLSDVLDAAPAPGGGDASAFARELVAAGRLTTYQADAVLERRFGDLRIGNYDILARLGAGGMGTVYKARHRRMKRVVALKVLSKEVAADAAFAQRFQREVETIARLAHPNIVMAFDADEADCGPFLVMEFVAGRDLATEVEHSGPLSVADAVGCVIQAARGLEYAHAQKTVHRDIKPANLLRDEAGVVKVADLGLARLTTGGGASFSVTQAGGIVGTADYMAPEQALDSTAVDERVDVYSLGCTLHFLLTGRPPYMAGTIMALLLKHRDAPIPSLVTDRPDVPPALDAVFRDMAAKRPDERVPTMTAVIRRLEAVSQTTRLEETRPAPQSAAVSQTNQTVALTPGADTSAVTPAASSGVYTPEAAGPPSLARTAVLAEPSRVQAGIIRRFLTDLGIESVHAAGSGKEAIELAKRHRADVIIAAMHLSDMTGADLARAVLADPECGRVGFILATSGSDSQDAAALPANPRAALVVKPFDLSRLREAIATVSSTT